MPLKITQDVSGNIISVENLPERDFPMPQPKQGTGKKSERTYVSPTRREGTESSVELIACSVCKASISKGRMARHLREAHLRETIQQREQQIRGIDRDLKKRAPGFHRREIEELQRIRNLLQKDMEDLQRIAQERLDMST